MSPLNLLTRIAQLEAGFDRLARRLTALETGKPAFPPRRGRPPGSKNGVDSRAWLADVLRGIADHPASRLMSCSPGTGSNLKSPPLQPN